MLKVVLTASLINVASAASFIQEVCTDAACSSGCSNNTLPTEACLTVTGGGSAKVTSCTSSGVVLESYSSKDCSGSSTKETQPVGVCAKIAGGSGYLENFCVSGGAVTDLKVQLVETNHDAARQAFIDEINSKQKLWKAGHNLRFRGSPIGVSKSLMGVKAGSDKMLDTLIRRGDIDVVHVTPGFKAPTDFDSATAFPKCAKVINDIRDQSNCGCCWAFSAAESGSDRLCIQTNATVAVPLSAQDMCFCSSFDGCDGGFQGEAWDYIKSHGIVTGAQNPTDIAKSPSDPFAGGGFCSGFSLPHCHHHGPTGSDPYPAEGAKGCPSESSPKCPTKCDSSAKAPHNDFKADKFKVSGVSNYANAAAMEEALVKGGPLAVSFTVYSDFENYASGIYKHTGGSTLGGHAVRVVGFGVGAEGTAEAGTKYWKVANSWNPYWGEKGYFRIVRGEDECGIESSAVASSASATWTGPGVSPGPAPGPSPSGDRFHCDKDTNQCVKATEGHSTMAKCKAACI